MKIRHPGLIRVLGYLVAWVVRLWVGTVRYRYRCIGPDVDPRRRDLTERYIYAFWHENMLLPACHYGRPDIRVLISKHADGELIAQACRHLGFGLVRGSTTRHGAEALLQMLQLAQTGHLAITPDGPQGPRRRVQPGLIFLAARTGLPIVAIGVGYWRPWRMKSWDRFALPRPWSRAVCVTAPPIRVARDPNRVALEAERQRVEETLAWATAEAEHWAETGQWLTPPESVQPAA
jgi:lysophospholipid acyltransferase (LPLAT)-like uncharacterized protein